MCCCLKTIQLNLSTLVFACLGTGGKGFYPDAAAQIAIQSVASFMKDHLDSKVPIVNRVIRLIWVFFIYFN